MASVISGRRSISTLAIAWIVLSVTSSQASIWNNPAGGSWANAANWDSLPNSIDAIADFSTLDIVSDATVTLDSATTFTVGSLLFGDTAASNNWIVNAGSPAGTITLAVASGSPTISVANQTVTINTTLAGTQGFTKTGNGTLAITTALPAGFGAVLDNAGVLTLSAANNYTAGTTLAAGATLNFNNASAIGTGPLVINGGTLNNSTGAAITNTKNNLQTWAGDFAFTGTQNLNLGTGAVSLGANAGAARTITVNAGTLTVGGIISNGTNVTTPTTGLIKAGNGILTLTGANTFNGGLAINAGTVRLQTSGTSGGTGTIVVNPSTNLVHASGNTFSSPINLAGGTIGSSNTTGTFSGGLNVTTNSTIRMADPQNLATNGEVNITGVLNGTGNLNVIAGSNNLGVDGGVGLRFRGTGASNYSGTITIGNNVKGEIQVAVAGPFSTVGTGKVILTAGDAALAGGLNAVTAAGGYSEFNIRNNFGNTINVPTNFEVAGTGLTVMNLPAGSGTLLQIVGNLKIGAGQEIALWKSSTGATTFQRLEFSSVTLTGGNATFSPKKPNFGVAGADAGDMILDVIGEQVAGSGIIMNGLRTLSLNGNNTFTGGVTINSGVLQITKAGALNSTTPQTVTFSAGTTGTMRLAGTSVTGGGLVTNATLGTPVVENASVTPATLTVNTTGTPTFAGVLQNGTGAGAFSFAKTGSGTQTLAGLNTYTGNTIVNGGTLALSNAATNNIASSALITVGPSGTLNVNGLASGAGLSLNANQTLANNGIVSGAVTVPANSFVAGTGTYANNVVFAGGAEKVTINGASADKILIAGAADFSGGGGITLALTTPATQPFYDVMVYGSLVGTPALNTPDIGRTHFSFAPSPPANTIRINVTGGPANIVWNNTGGSPADGTTWDAQTNPATPGINKNWSNAGSPDFYFDADNVTFDDNNNSHYSVTLNANVLPGSVTVNNSAGDYVIGGGGSIGGIGGLTKSGSRALTLSTANTYTGGTTLNQGNLNLGNASAISTGTLTLNGGTLDNTSGADLTLASNNSQSWAGSFSYAGTLNGLNLGAGSVTLNSSPTVTVAANTLTVGGIIGNGTGNSFTKAGSGILVLTGANTFSGGLTVSGGGVRALAAGATGTGLATVNSGATLAIGGTLSGPISLSGGSIGAANNGTANLLGTNAFTSGDLTAAAATTSTIYLTDPQALSPFTNADNGEMILTGTLHGSGDIVVIGGSTSNRPDAGGGFRFARHRGQRFQGHHFLFECKWHRDER